MTVPITAVSPLGPEFKISTPRASGTDGAEGGTGADFGKALMQSLSKLDDLQKSADAQSQALATGKAEDITQVVLEVERASLSLQLASQVRNRAVDAYHEIFRMQI
jgi:flagellar hook-basal body complex protein FliE